MRFFKIGEDISAISWVLKIVVKLEGIPKNKLCLSGKTPENEELTLEKTRIVMDGENLEGFLKDRYYYNGYTAN